MSSPPWSAECPEGWQRISPDAQHRLSVDTAAYAGARCIKAVADAGAQPSWFNYSQSGLPVRPGERITLRVMVRAEGVKGSAGWYVHAGHEKKSDVLNRVFSAGNGTFGWKKLEMKVTIPPDCTIGADAPWLAAKPGEGAWQYRVPVRAANFTDEAQARTLSACSLTAALRATRSPEYTLTFNGNELRTCRLGDQLLFSCDLPARSISTFYLYVRSGRGGAEEKPEELKSALGSAIPSDQVLVKRPRLGNAQVFEDLLNSPANLVKNPSWEAGASGWDSGTSKPGGIRYEVATEGGRFGKAFAKTEIPRTVRPNWNGWRQTVKVKPGHTYLYGAFISGDDLQTAATVHVHQRTAKGALARGGMISAGRGVNGTVPWTPVFSTARASEDVAYFALQLTMNGAGTVAYDGVLVAEYAAARTGDPEFAASGADASALRVVQVDPVVKVFRETPVEETAGTAFGISLARNETEPLQLAVRTARAVADLTAQVELPAPLKVEVGRVRHVPVDHPTSYYSCTTPAWELRYPRNAGSSDGWSGWWPDPIDPVVGGPAPANETQPFWINVTAGADVPPGTYTGKITWKADGAVVRTDTFSVKVWNFTLDAPPYFPAIYDLRVGWQWKGLGATSAERREKLWAFLAEKKCCPDRLGAEVKFKKGADGTVTADFTEYDAVASRYFDHYRFPVSYMPGCFYCFGWAMPPKAFLGENPYEGEWPYEGADWTKLRPAYKNLYQQALRLYWNHIKEKGWADKLVLYISDEPHFSRSNVVQQMKACCAMIHEVDPKIPIYSSTWRHCPEWNDSLDVWGIGSGGRRTARCARTRRTARWSACCRTTRARSARTPTSSGAARGSPTIRGSSAGTPTYASRTLPARRTGCATRRATASSSIRRATEERSPCRPSASRRRATAWRTTTTSCCWSAWRRRRDRARRRRRGSWTSFARSWRSRTRADATPRASCRSQRSWRHCACAPANCSREVTPGRRFLAGSVHHLTNTVSPPRWIEALVPSLETLTTQPFKGMSRPVTFSVPFAISPVPVTSVCDTTPPKPQSGASMKGLARSESTSAGDWHGRDGSPSRPQ